MKRGAQRELTSGRDVIQVPSRNMPGVTEETHDKRHSNIRCTDREKGNCLAVHLALKAGVWKNEQTESSYRRAAMCWRRM